MGAQAAERGVSLADLLAEIVSRANGPLPEHLEKVREGGERPWSPDALAEDERAFLEFEQTGEGVPMEEMIAWLRSLDTHNPLPRPVPRKL